MEGAYNEHLVSIPDHFRNDQKLKHIIKGIVQRLLLHRHGAPTTSVGNLFQYLTTLSTEEMLSDVQSEPALLQLWIIPACPAPGFRAGEITSLSTSPLRKLQRATRLLLSLLFSKLSNHKALSCSSEDMPSRIWYPTSEWLPGIDQDKGMKHT